jgi:hypothetical protein
MTLRARLADGKSLRPLLSVATLLTVSGPAWAQTAAAAAPPDAPAAQAGKDAPAATAPVSTAPAATPNGAETLPAVQAAAPAAAAPAAPPAGEAAAPPPAPPAEAAPPAPPWYNNLKLSAFADAYYSMNFNYPHPQGGTNNAVVVPGGNGERAYDFNNGFSLHWAGIDATYNYGSVGGTVSLRFGPSTVGYNSYDTPNGAQFLKQGFVTWKPMGADSKLALDVGKFDQPYGSEVADSQLNINYTRTFLYWLGQPLHFTGVRVDYAVTDQFDIKFFAVNGWNRVVANNSMGKVGIQNFGTQIMVKPVPEATFLLGYMLGANQDDVSTTPVAGGGTVSTYDSDAKTRLRHFVDFVADVSPIPALRFLANADYGTEKLSDASAAVAGQGRAKWYGANLVVSIKASDQFFIAPRGEIYVDDHYNFPALEKKVTFTDATITAGYTPTPNFVLKLDLRADHASEPIFPSKYIDTSNHSQYTATLGVVATTN